MRTIFLFLILFLFAIPKNLFSQVDTSQFLNKIYSYNNGSDKLPYRLFVPNPYNPSIQYPLVMVLHGSAECGNDNVKPLSKMYTTYYAHDSIQAIQPCFVLVPQCLDEQENAWCLAYHTLGLAGYKSYDIGLVPPSKTLLAALNLIRSLKNDFNLDSTRYYITGVSLGGNGTWEALIRYTNFFAKAIPMSCASDPTKAEIIKHIPIRIFHATNDGTVPVRGSIDMDSALRAVKADDEVLIEENGGHYDGYWFDSYATPGLTKWLFSIKSSLYITPSSIELPYNLNSSSSFQITSDTSWKVKCNQSWLNVSPDTGYKNETINIVSEENTGSTNRVAIVTISGNGFLDKTLTVTQLGKILSVSDKQNNSNIIFPNPIKDIVHVNGIDSQTKIEFYSISGVWLKEIASKGNSIEVNVNDFKSGIYLIRLISPFNTKIYTVVKK